MGTNATGGHRGSNDEAKRDANWGLLANEATKLAYAAAIRLPEFDALKPKAVAAGYKVAKRPGAHYGWTGWLYLLADGGALVWPDWLELCRGLPKTVPKDVPRYQKACGAIAKEFFGDPGNLWADALVKTRLANQSKAARARARLDAVRLTVAAVATLGVAKRKK